MESRPSCSDQANDIPVMLPSIDVLICYQRRPIEIEVTAQRGQLDSSYFFVQMRPIDGQLTSVA